MVTKLSTDKLYENSATLINKLKDLVAVCNKKFGQEWGGKGGAVGYSNTNVSSNNNGGGNSLYNNATEKNVEFV